jgi:hypothetical protein
VAVGAEEAKKPAGTDELGIDRTHLLTAVAEPIVGNFDR